MIRYFHLLIIVFCFHVNGFSQQKDTLIVAFRVTKDCSLFINENMTKALKQLKAGDYVFGVGKYTSSYPLILVEKNGQVGYLSEACINIDFNQRRTLYRADTNFTIAKAKRSDFQLTQLENDEIVNYNSSNSDVSTDSTMLMCKISSDANVRSGKGMFGTPIAKILQGEYVWAIDKGPNYSVKIVKDSIIGFVSRYNVFLTDTEYETLDGGNQKNKIIWAMSLKNDLISEKQKDEDSANRLNDELAVSLANEQKQRQIKLQKVKNLGLGITSYQTITDTYTAGFDISFLNAYSKTIKYIWITTNAYNPVKDLVSSKTVKAIGPIIPGDEGEYSFEDIYFSRIIENVKLIKLRVQYMDLTSKEFTGSTLKDLHL